MSRRRHLGLRIIALLALMTLAYGIYCWLSRPEFFVTEAGKKWPLFISRRDRETLTKFFGDYGTKSPAEKAAAYSQLLLGQDATWEQALDDGPKEIEIEALHVSLHHLDCVTYTEQTLAAARAKNLREFFSQLIHVGYYGDRLAFVNRYHFPEADWIPQNTAHGVVKNLTPALAASVGAEGLSKVTVDISKGNWFRTFFPEHAREFSLTFPAADVMRADIDAINFNGMWTVPTRTKQERDEFQKREREYVGQILLSKEPEEQTRLQIELSGLRHDYRMRGAALKPSFVEALPDFAVAAVVVPTHAVLNSKHQLVTQMLVSHFTILVKRGGQLYVRHAATQFEKKTVELPFDNYFSKFVAQDATKNNALDWDSTRTGLHIMGLGND